MSRRSLQQAASLNQKIKIERKAKNNKKTMSWIAAGAVDFGVKVIQGYA